jgi:hypothetical protein
MWGALKHDQVRRPIGDDLSPSVKGVGDKNRMDVFFGHDTN